MAHTNDLVDEALWIGVDPGFNPPSIKWFATNITIQAAIKVMKKCPCRGCGWFDKTNGSDPCKLQIACPTHHGSKKDCPTCPVRDCEEYTNCVVFDGVG